MKKTISRLVAVVLVLTLALSIASVALAAQTLYATQAVNVRTGPGTKYVVLGSLSKGQAIQATGSIVSGWTEVQYSTYEKGYVKSNYLTSYAATTTPSGTVCYNGKVTAKVCPDCGSIYKTTSSLNIRSGPSTKYAVIGALAKGQQVTRIGQSGKWFKILTNEGANAYVSSNYLKAVSNAYQQPTTSYPCAPSFGNNSLQLYPEGTRMYTTTALNVRKGPGTGYEIMTSIPSGESVRFLDNIGNWYRISWGGYTGYCSGSYLTTSGTPSYSYPCYNNGYSNYCGYCNRPTCNGTCWNSCNNPCSAKAYVYAQVGGIYQTRRATSMFESPSASATVTVSVPAGRYVRVIGIQSQSDFTQISYDNGAGEVYTGYVYTNSLY